MYAYAKGDLFKSGAQALVNPVNTVGVMGKGLALQFRKRFPDMFRAYVRACKAGEVQPGRMWIYRTDMTAGPEFVICFPTKRHWRDKSDIEDIRLGLADLFRIITDYGIQSIAIPPLGCGNGGLKWDMVRGLMEEMLMDVPADWITVYEPADQQDSPLPEKKNMLTVQRAAILDLMIQFMSGSSAGIFMAQCGDILQDNGVCRRRLLSRHP